MPQPFIELIDMEYLEPLDLQIEKKIKQQFKEKEISCESKLDQYKEMNHTEKQVKILGYSLGLILATLAILNYINMIVLSIQNRSKEFATCESIGMTTKQLLHILSLEGFIYGSVSIVLTVLLGGPFSYFIFQSMNIYEMPYVLPANILLLFANFLIICMLVPPVIYKGTQKVSVIERLREKS